MARENDEPIYVTALRRLVSEIAAGDYRDGQGDRLADNPAYLEAIGLLEVWDSLDRRH